MAQAAGYAVLPISPSLIGITEELRNGLIGPTQKASKQAGQNIRKGMADGVSQASKDVEKAHYRIKRAAEEQTAAESKLSEQKLKTEAANKAVEAAARKRAEAESKGIDAVEKAEQELLKKRAAAEREARNLASAEGQVEKALSESARAAQSLTDRQEALTRATEDGGTESKKFRDRLREMGDEAETTGGLFEGMSGKIAGWAGGLAGVMGVGAFAGMGAALTAETDLINLQLGYTGAAAEGVGESIKQALSSGVAGSAEEAANAIGALESQWKYLGSEGEQTAGELADNFMAFAKVFEVDVAEATQTAGQLITNGLATDAENAADLMTTAMQRVPQAMRDELPEIINEYGVNFKNLGFSGEEAFSILVNQAENGKIALDKTGDALKEFSLFAVDPAKAEVFESIGLSASDMATAVAEGGDKAQAKLQETAQKLLEIEDPGKRATTAIELFGAPLEDLGGPEGITPFLEGLTGIENGMAGAAGSSQLLADEIANSLDGRINRLKGSVTALAGDAFMWAWELLEDDLIPAFKDMGEWVQRNEEWLGPLAAAVGAAAGAWGLWTLAVKGWQTATKIATGIQVAFNAVMAANPIMLAVMAVAALAAGLTYFFTQTETGKEVWESLTSSIADGWDWVTEKVGAGIDWIGEKWSDFTGWISTAWDGITSLFQGDFTTDMREAFGLEEDSPIIVGFFFLRDTAIKVGEILGKVWDGIVTAGKIAFAIIGTVVLTPLMLAWTGLSEAWSWGYEHLISPTIDAFAAAGTWLWEKALSPAFSGITNGFLWVRDGLVAGWFWIDQNMIQPFAAGATWVGDQFSLAVGWITTKWSEGQALLHSGWTWIDQNVFALFRSGAQWLSDKFTESTGVVTDRWESTRSLLHSGWTWIDDNVFSKFRAGVDLMRSGAEIAMDGIGKAFDWLREKTAKPVNFVIETVYMGGIREAWGAVAGLVGLEDLPKIEKIGGFAEGTARVPGARTRYDNVHMMSQDGRFAMSLRGGEGVLVPEVVDGLGEGTVNALNHAGLHGGKSAVDKVLRAVNIGGFSEGGITNLAGALSGIQRSHAQFVGRFFPGLFNLTSAGRHEPGSFHDFGSMAATDWQAKDGQYATQMPTAGSKALARAIFTNFPNSAELIHWPLDGWQNINDGAPFNYGAGTNAGHGNHVHWATRSPLQFDGDNIVLTDAGGGGVFETITNMAKRLWDGVIDKIPGFPGADTLGKFGQLPAAFLKKAASSAWDYIKGLADKLMPFGGSSSGGAEQWRGLASQALKRMGYGDEYLDAMLQQIQIESTGDPNAVNNWDSNAMRGTPSRGLLQVIDPTYRDVRRRYPDAFEGLPDDSTHPLTNLVAGVGAVKRDWGGPGGRWPTRDGYHDGGLAGVGQGWLKKTAIDPEMVLNPETTQAFLRWMDTSPESARVIAKEIAYAFRGGDWGYGETASYIGEKNAQRLVDEVSWMGNTVGEIKAAWTGGDAGYAGVARYLGGNEKLAKDLLNRVESIGTVTEEISAAWSGGDWGYGELSTYLGEDMARETVNVVAATGELSRAVQAWAAVAWSQVDTGALGGEVSSIGRGYLEAQATSLLDVVVLGGLVPLASGWVDDHGPAVMESARSLMSGDVTATAGLTPGGVSIVIEAESDEDLVRVGQLKQLADRVHGIDVQVNTKRRPPAGMVTRGGPM